MQRNQGQVRKCLLALIWKPLWGELRRRNGAVADFDQCYRAILGIDDRRAGNSSVLVPGGGQLYGGIAAGGPGIVDFVADQANGAIAVGDAIIVPATASRQSVSVVWAARSVTSMVSAWLPLPGT